MFLKMSTLMENYYEYKDNNISDELLKIMANPEKMPDLAETFDTLVYTWVEGGGLPNRLGGETDLFILPGKTTVKIVKASHSVVARVRPSYTWTLHISGPYWGREYLTKKEFGQRLPGMMEVTIAKYSDKDWKLLFVEYSSVKWLNRLYTEVMQEFYRQEVNRGTISEQRWFPGINKIIELVMEAGLEFPVPEPPKGQSGYEWYL